MQIHFAWIDRPAEHAVSVVHDDVTLVVRLHHRKEEHVLDICGRHHTPTLAGRTCRSDPDLLSYFPANDGFGLVLVLGNVRVRDVGVEPVPEELFHQRDLAIVSLCDVPDIRPQRNIAWPPRGREVTTDYSDP